MKEFIEEYGGVTIACILGLVLLKVLLGLLGEDGGIAHLVQVFLKGIGATGL